jgi:excisionase family DNA binding protein
VDELAEAVPFARRAYLDACRKGQLRHKRIGKSVLVKRADLDAWIEAHGGPERRPAEAPPQAPAEPTTDDLLRSAGIVLRAPTGPPAGKVKPPVTTPQRRAARRPK